MKKISSLIVCLVLLAVGTAFALDLPDALKIPGLTVTGDVRTGLRVDGATYDKFGKNDVFADVGDGDRKTGAQVPTVYAYSDDLDDGTPFRAQLQLVWERDNLGVKTRFRYRPDGATEYTVMGDHDNNDATPDEPVGKFSQDRTLNQTLANLNNTVNKAFVYANILDKKVKVSVGKGTDDAWGLFYSNFQTTTGLAGKDGVAIEVKPVDGLNVGAFYGTGNLFAKAFTNGDFSDNSEADRRFTVGAKYTSDLFSIVAATGHNFVNFFGEEDSYKHPGPLEYDAKLDTLIANTSNLLVGLQVKPVDPLQIDISFAAVNLGSKTYKGAFNGGEDMAAYKKGNFNPWWKAWLKFKAAYDVNDQLGIALGISGIEFADAWYYDVADDDGEKNGLGYLFPITISPSATYAINDELTAGAELNFYINSGGSDQFGFGLKPSAEFSLGSGATFVVWDEIAFWAQSNDDIDFLKKHPYIFTVGGNGGAAGTTNALQFDFVWTF